MASSTTSEQQRKKTFFDLPPEIRNPIYQLCIEGYNGESIQIKSFSLKDLLPSSNPEVPLAVDLARAFPFLLASKQVLKDALPMCVHASVLSIDHISQVEALARTALQSPALALHLGFVREMHIDGMHWPKFRWHKPTPLRFTFATVAQFFTRLEKLTFKLDDEAMCYSIAIRGHVCDYDVPSLREVKIRNMALEWRMRFRSPITDCLQCVFTSEIHRHYDWQENLDVARLRGANNELATILKAKRERNALRQ